MVQRAICVLLALATAVLAVFVMLGNREVSRLNARIQELEAQLSAGGPENAYAPDEAAAEFNGGIVTVAEASAEYALFKPYYEMLGMDEADYAAEAKMDVLNLLVERKILENKAREFGVYELDEAALAELEQNVRAEYEENVEYYMAFRFDESKSEAEARAETIEYLNENGYAYEDLLQQAKADAWSDRLYEYVTANVAISDAELRDFYGEQVQRAEMTYTANYAEYESDCAAGKDVLWHPEGVRRVQMLVIPFDFEQAARYADLQALLVGGDASRLNDLDALYCELEEAGEQMLRRLQNGEDFEALLEETGYGNAEGVNISGQSSIFGDALRDAAMALAQTGDLSGLVRCDEGLCILRYAGDVAPGPVPFEAVSDALRANHTEELRRSSYNAMVMQWLAEADTVYYPERF